MNAKQPDNGQIFNAAADLQDPADRAAYLDEVCSGDLRRRAEIEELLKHDVQAGSFLESPPQGVAATMDTAPLAERPGTQIGRYKLLQEIGEGGMGTVFLAEQLQPVKRRVALKIIKQGMDTRQFIARFEAERQALALMDHPSIARVFDAGCTETGRPYFVMELVKGIPITRFCDENRLTARERLQLFVSVCHAVQHAHQKGIIHRDLKPSNVLVALYDDRPVPKVIDFGVAKATNQELTEKTLFTQIGQIVGTWEYMSPEQAVLNQLDVDTRADIYSLGVILYLLLTGVTPLESDRLRSAALEETLRLIREEEPPKPSTRISSLGNTTTATAAYRGTDASSLAKTLRGDLDWIVMKAIEKNRSRRYETANGFAADLNRYLNGEPIEARPPSTVYRLRKVAARHRAALLATAIVMVAMIAGTVSSTWLAILMMRARDNAVAAEEREKTNSKQLIASETRLREALTQLSDELKDRCLAAVMSGDENKAEEAIQRAESAKLSETWRNILRGQLALSSGKLDGAIKYLRPAAQDCVAAQGMLAMAYLYIGRIEESVSTVEELTQRQPTTAEDYLFMGQALINVDARKAVKTIRYALEKRDSPLARMILARALATVAMETGDRTSIESAVWEAQVARSFIGDTPMMLTTHLFVQHVAIKIGLIPCSDGVLVEARSIADKIRHFPMGRLELTWFLADFGDHDFAERTWSDVTRMSGLEAITYTACLLHRKTPEEVLKIIEERFELSDAYTQCNRAGVMALIPEMHCQAQELCEEQVRRPGSYDLRNVFLQLLYLLGRADDAQRLSQDLLDTSVYPFRYQKEVMQHVAGEIETRVFIENAGKSRINQTAAFFQVAMNELAEGNRNEARAYFGRCVDIGLFVDGNYWWAKRYLACMEESANWPEWIPPQAQ